MLDRGHPPHTVAAWHGHNPAVSLSIDPDAKADELSRSANPRPHTPCRSLPATFGGNLKNGNPLSAGSGIRRRPVTSEIMPLTWKTMVGADGIEPPTAGV